MTLLHIVTLLFLCCTNALSRDNLKDVTDDFSKFLKIRSRDLRSRFRRESGDVNRDSDPYFKSFLQSSNENVQLKKSSQLTPDVESQLPAICGSGQAFFLVKHNVIIKTKESMTDGARFIASPRVHSNQDCLDHCCSERECTLSVFDGKGQTSCYLFDCGEPSHCHFTEHSNYTSTIVKRIPIEPTTVHPPAPPVELEHESDLEDLKQLIAPETKQAPPRKDWEPVTQAPKTTTKLVPHATTSTTTTAPPVTTTIPTTPAPKKPVSLLQICERSSDCEDENAVCESICICRAGMKPSYGKCAWVEQSHQCSHLEFPCQLRSPDSYPHCIASYDRCDGIAQCPLGDDEVGCQSGPDSSSSSHIQRRPGVQPRVLTTPAPPRGQTQPQTEVHVPDIPKHDENVAESRPDESSTKNTDETQSSSSSQQKVEPKPVESPPPSQKPAVPQSNSTNEKQPDSTSSSAKVKVKTTVAPDTPKLKPQVTLGDSANRIIVSRIEIERQNADSTFLTYDGDLQGAVVALALGLTISAILLVFVVCKLRSVKRRLRRGRLASNDADYLINGMYL